MLPDVQGALNTITSKVVTLEHAAGAGRVFELFVMTTVARELQSSGFDVWLQRSDGTRIHRSDPDRRFIQRGGAPSGVASKFNGPDNPSVVGFRWRSRPAWEIWNGVQFGGRSGAAHEIDIAGVPAGVGDALRSQAGGGIPLGRPRLAIECKDVGQAGSLDEMRAFIARLYDLTLLNAHHRHLGISDARAIHPGSPAEPKYRAIVTYWQENRRTKNIIARRTGFSVGTAPLSEYHRIEPHEDIVVGNANVDELAAAVVQWALRYAR